MSVPRPTRSSGALVCYVTDRRQFAGSAGPERSQLMQRMIETAGAGVDWIQIREKDLSAAELLALARETIRSVPGSCRVLVNDRLDVVCAAGAAGVHLGEKSIPVQGAKKFVREWSQGAGILVGASVHSIPAAGQAAADGADYLVFGPVFATPSKAAFGPAQGLSELAAVCRAVSIPVLAIGGITPQNARSCLAQGAAGVCAIRSFQQTRDLPALVRQLRGA